MKDDSKTLSEGLFISQGFDQLSQNTETGLETKPDITELYIEHEERSDGSEAGIDTTQSEPIQKDGRLSPDARRALIRLLRQGVILADQKRSLFEALCRNEKVIRDHLADMYLRMSLDQKAGVALLLQKPIEDNDKEDDEIISLISRRTLSLYDTLLLLVLRKHYQERESSGAQRIFIDADQVEAQLTPFLPLTNRSRADRESLNASLKRMRERRILGKVRGDENRFEITPVIRYVVNAEFLETMLTEYRQLAEQSGSNIDKSEDE